MTAVVKTTSFFFCPFPFFPSFRTKLSFVFSIKSFFFFERTIYNTIEVESLTSKLAPRNDVAAEANVRAILEANENSIGEKKIMDTCFGWVLGKCGNPPKYCRRPHAWLFDHSRKNSHASNFDNFCLLFFFFQDQYFVLFLFLRESQTWQ